MTIVYARELEVGLADFMDVLERSGLAERRPMERRDVLEKMVAGADLWITARDASADGKIIGLARALSDFAYVCYCSELAVDRDYQDQDIGRRMIEAMKTELDETCNLVVISAPAAEGFYEAVGMERLDRAFLAPAREDAPA